MGRRTLAASVCVVLAMVGPLRAATPATPATSPSATPGATPGAAREANANRLTFLGNQLSADEAAITAINRALVRNGYKVAVANAKATNAEKGNELMNRNGGGPVPWQETYGRTATTFFFDGMVGGVDVDYDAQFRYIYHANDQQIEAAKTQVESIGKSTDTLLARRTELEQEESAVWATIAFEGVQNRDILLRPIYRDELDGTASGAATQPDIPPVAAARAGAIYMRTLDNATRVLADAVEHDQMNAFFALRDTMAAAGSELQDAAAQFADSPGVDPRQAKSMLDLVAVSKRLQSYCKDLCDASSKAKEAASGGASEEARKQMYRGAMQESLLAFPEAAAQFDTGLSEFALASGVRAKSGTKSTDAPIPVAYAGVATAKNPPGQPFVAAPAGSRVVDVLQMIDLSKDALAGKWTLANGKLQVNTSPTGTAHVEIPYVPGDEYDFHITFNRSQGDEGLLFICSGGGHSFDWVLTQKVCGFEMIRGRSTSTNSSSRRRTTPWFTNGERHETIISVRKGKVQGYLDGQMVTEVSKLFDDLRPWPGSKQPHQNTLGIFVRDSAVTIESATVVEITGAGKSLR